MQCLVFKLKYADRQIQFFQHLQNVVAPNIEEQHIYVFSPFGVLTIAKCNTSEWGSFATPQCLR